MKLSLLGLAMGLASQAALAAPTAPPLQDKQAFIDLDPAALAHSPVASSRPAR